VLCHLAKAVPVLQRKPHFKHVHPSMFKRANALQIIPHNVLHIGIDEHSFQTTSHSPF